MAVTLLAIVSFLGGGLVVYFVLESRKRTLDHLKVEVETQAAENRAVSSELRDRHAKLQSDAEALARDLIQYRAARQEFDVRVIRYEEYAAENKLLKIDLRNIAMTVSRQEVENEGAKTRVEGAKSQCNALGEAYLNDTQKWIASNLTVNNYAASKERLLKAVARVRGIGVSIETVQEQRFVQILQAEYERVVRAAAEREEQARIRAQIRDEALREREAQEAIDQAEHERLIVEAALAEALRVANNQHTAEVERLQKELAEAQLASMRAISQAQITRVGYVYVISNLGSFGDGVFKIGMTRRLEPLDRVIELGDASVPFPFDVHMMISTTDAPKLETALHKAFHRMRLNKTNPRKEFFRTSLGAIVKVVEANHGTVEYTVDAAALQYRQSQTMSEADLEFIEETFAEAEAATGAVGIVED